ncbi:AAA family ATPase [Ramlibacter alkalitolerans]|uniref:AAA family ATPase n=2 Tax=Ramlibacter alkalitolerans TaxID=2039631 RepID=A0ABS1JTP8_9BURK|nr:AAA family ATPase [Ramlibacter alkalitolerans]
MGMTASRRLVQALARRLGAELIETHISWVLLAGALAYKVKKPLRLPFVDYSTPERRQGFCQEEVRLNERLAPGLYLGVARITGSSDAPEIDGSGPALEYAVRMRRFPAGALLSERAAQGTLDAALVDRLADRLGVFHAEAPRCTAAGIALPARALAALQGAAGLWPAPQQAQLARWIAGEAKAVDALWQLRAGAGCVREGHGDLHLANLLTLEGEVMAFDALEFDASLRCIDVVEDIAFTVMDLAAHDLPALAWRLLDGWLQRTGEYEGVAGLRLCLVYRALVRALACHLREPHGAGAQRYAREALRWTAPAAPRLWITHGLPGSGKSWQSQRLLQATGAIRIRSDVERKRLHGLAPLARSRDHGLDLYTPQATRATLARLFTLAGALLRAGWPVVLDAAFLRRAERDAARTLARTEGVPFAILDCEAPPEVLRERLRTRTGDASEADVGVLELLAAVREPLGEDERG